MSTTGQAEDRLRAWKLKDRGQTFMVCDPELQRDDKADMVRLRYAGETLEVRHDQAFRPSEPGRRRDATSGVGSSVRARGTAE